MKPAKKKGRVRIELPDLPASDSDDDECSNSAASEFSTLNNCTIGIEFN